jgi:pilus assembly protein CpaB
MLACFIVAALYFFWLTQPSPGNNQQNAAVAPATASELDLVDVLVPIERIEAGVALEPTMFRKESRPAIAVGGNNIKDFDQLKGAYAASFIAAGQPLLAEYVTLKKPINQIQVVIPDGYRAVTMAVDLTTSVEGWARPGAKVDVVLTQRINGKQSATVIVQNSKVLSAGHAVEDKQGKDQGPMTVTLLVTMEEAAKIQLAASSGVLSLALRGDEDTIESPNNATIMIDSILGGDANLKPAVIPPEGRVKIDGRQFIIQNGKLVPEGSTAR